MTSPSGWNRGRQAQSYGGSEMAGGNVPLSKGRDALARLAWWQFEVCWWMPSVCIDWDSGKARKAGE